MKKPQKYHAIKGHEDGYVFDSQKELRRYRELKLMQRAGLISDLVVHPKFPLVIDGAPLKIPNKNGVGRSVVAIMDFSFTETSSGARKVVDTKGMDLYVSKLKRALVEAIYRVKITVER